MSSVSSNLVRGCQYGLLLALLAAPIAKAGRAHGQGGVEGIPDDYVKQSEDFLKTHPGIDRDNYWSVAKLDQVGRGEFKAKGPLPKLVRGNPGKQTVALTFDDGPYPDATPKLLAVLKKENVKATMFLIGKKVMAHPDMVRQMAAEHHELANHTFNHFRLPTLTPKMVDQELYYGAVALTKVVPGVKTADICRPPGGQYNGAVLQAAKRHGYTVTLWTDDPDDYANLSVNEIERRVLRDASNGGIILLHDDTPNTVAALPTIIETLKKRNYRFVTCSEMEAAGGAISNGGPNTYKG